MNDIAVKLLEYYYTNRRILPWRENPLPYYVWLSEIMLQQTRVDTVIPYFNRFIESFPSIRALADAKEEDLMKLWEGLGYYSRARNLQKAAKLLVDFHNAQLPRTKSELLKLPGIGDYTAGAISSIAFGENEVAIDGNLIRIASRLNAFSDSTKTSHGKKYIQSYWQEILPEGKAGDFNQALMDLGATICLPNAKPLCLICPIRSHCIAFEQGNPQDYPKKEPKKEKRVESKTVFILYHEGQILLEKRKPGGLLGGLLQFPLYDGHLSKEEVVRYLSDKGFHPLRIQRSIDAKHVFSHIQWNMISWEIELDPFLVEEKPLNFILHLPEKEYREYLLSKETTHSVWIDQSSLNQVTLPTAFRAFRNLVKNKFYINSRTGASHEK